MNRDSVVTNGCSGHCCENFNFPFTPKDYEENVKASQRGAKSFVSEFGFILETAETIDLLKIQEMLIFLGMSEVNGNGGDNYTESLKRLLISQERWKGSFKESLSEKDLKFIYEKYYMIIEDEIVKCPHYTCKHFDSDNRICNIYDDRPMMCRKYDSGDCKYKGCNGCIVAEKELKLKLEALYDSNNELEKLSNALHRTSN